MSEMIERVARAMCLFDSTSVLAVRQGEPVEIVSQRRWEGDSDFYLESARAAIEAMREPTVRMIGAGWDEITARNSSDDLTFPEAVTDIWEAMIDAALT